jgi:CDP-diglyceride synthetase
MSKQIQENWLTLVVHILIIILVTFIHYFIANKKENWSSEKKLSLYNAFHFTLTTHTTLGYGDLWPIGTVNKIIVHLHMLIVFIITVLNLFSLNPESV